MRRLERLISEVRNATDNQSPTSGSGIADEDLVQLFNNAQDRIYSRIMTKYPEQFITTQSINTTAGTETYTLNSAAYLGGRIVSVEWLLDDTDDYRRLDRRTFHSRYTDDSGTPAYYFQSGSTIYVNPRPDETKTSGLRVTYQAKPRRLDIRRGYVTSATVSGGFLTAMTLADPSTLLTKDADLDTASNAVLQECDFLCVVDLDGVSVLNEIQIDDYNTSTRVLTLTGSGTATTLANTDIESNYIVCGKYATSHCELPDMVERYLLVYVEQSILRRDGNDLEADRKARELIAIESDIMEAYGAFNWDVFETPLDPYWFQE
jgi:hypothetical protein